MIKSNRGQLSIFMGITLIIVMGMLAFIINVGLFVKAKINLQNATDAAAFSGAATQARQLTNIAYANWELRNTYKEWMFKYYVLGQLGIAGTNLKNVSGNGKINFTLPNFSVDSYAPYDKYNLPSICVHNNSGTNICSNFNLPGIPRFDAIAVAGISEIHEAFVNELVVQKGADCSRRTKMNYATALSWAYGSGTDIVADAPLIATNRPGAWPEALELAFRIRNLEMIVNRPPVPELTRKNIEEFRQAPEIGLNERPVKAFWSAYRNLSGGAYKDNINKAGNNVTDEMSANFKLTEISPTPFDSHVGRDTLSSFLIPDTFTYKVPGGGKATTKYYLDLQMMPVNLATMYSSFVGASNINAKLDPSNPVKAEAACGVSKTAMPVPGYILGFTKNPEVITYYAVKAETKFVGLFFPISTGDSEKGIKLTAYSAAKPFGGRIGPKLFNYEDEQRLVARDISYDTNNRSGSYISGLDISTPPTGYELGMPIPSNKDFWINGSNAIIGGIPDPFKQVSFGLPNMIYDFEDEGNLTDQTKAVSSLQIIKPVANPNFKSDEDLGLYHAPQYRFLKSNAGTITPGSIMTGQAVLKALIRSRRPTKYDAINYLVPDFREVSDQNNIAPIVQRLNPIDGGFTYKLFAPLMGENLLYENDAAVTDIVGAYLQANRSAVDQYLRSILQVANSIYKFSDTNKGDTKAAARSIHVNASNTSTDFLPPLLNDADCKLDLASKFNYFFNSKVATPACGVTPLMQTMIKYISNHSLNINGFDKKLYYVGTYSEPNFPAEGLMTAYYPGERQGTYGGTKALVEHPLKVSSGTDSYSARRNSYSTKFVQMAKVMDSPPGVGSATMGMKDYEAEPALREFGNKSTNDLVGKVHIKNPIKYNDPELNNIYYLDF